MVRQRVAVHGALRRDPGKLRGPRRSVPGGAVVTLRTDQAVAASWSRTISRTCTGEAASKVGPRAGSRRASCGPDQNGPAPGWLQRQAENGGAGEQGNGAVE